MFFSPELFCLDTYMNIQLSALKNKLQHLRIVAKYCV